MNHNETYYKNGLTENEVAERIKNDQINYDTTLPTKSIKRIIFEHTVTLFNLLNLALAIIVLIFGSVKNALFMGVVISNAFIGIFQEIRAKKAVDKLSIINKAAVSVLRDGKEIKLPINKIVKDDILILHAGNQIPSDSVIIAGECDVNESLLTGESDLIHKKSNDRLLSGSFIVSGTVKASVENVGADNYASKIIKNVKYIKKHNSQILKTINSIIFILSIIIVPIGGILCFSQINVDGNTLSQAVISSVAAIIGMIPEGLVLLTSTVLAVSVIRLSKKNVLVQQLYCIESLARVNVLCLDKTGTLTEGKMQVEKIDCINSDETEIKKILYCLVSTLKDDNATSLAIQSYCKCNHNFKVTEKLPFSSSRKLSAVTIDGKGSFILGAAEFILNDSKLEAFKKASENENDSRTVILAKASSLENTNKDAELLAIIYIKDVIRKNAAETLEYFKEQGVKIKIISGDNPRTVSSIGKKVNLDNYNKFIDMSTVNEVTPEIADKYTVFGRVTPEQKRELIKNLHTLGNTVGMTGDGVNDVPALKEADCSIAMASGSDAAKNVAELVLLDSDFSSMPSVVAEGRRTINNIQRSASLFLVKTIYSTLLAIIFSILPFAYPFIPIQMSLISSFTIGIPSFILALEPNKERVKGNFLFNVLSKAFPAGITVVLCVVISTLCSNIFKFSQPQCSAICFYLTALCGLMLLFKISVPFNTLRKLLFGFVCTCIGICVIFFSSFFSLELLTLKSAAVLLILFLFAVFSFLGISYLFEKYLIKDEL